jgi:uncharacterized protein YoxC
MTLAEFALIVATVLCAIGFAALIVVLLRVLDTLRSLRGEVEMLRNETQPLLAEMRVSTSQARETMNEARQDLQRFDRVLGSAESISEAVAGGSRVARVALSAPIIKAAGLATGTRRTVRRLRGAPIAAPKELQSSAVTRKGRKR